ncbi:hypothetical protein TWF970_004139 [Orbilia oligospora]|uniref:Lytic polysaccharide monooxygenase n=1 Tax=Orbilia oligospora TaxID=2813651 RepID=A0A7C8RGG0_ORBOL|nr:hypothetical protein TWF970_004139 [Orbilia oligospora]
MRLVAASLAILATLTTVSGHASIISPKPIKFDIDTDYNAPLVPGFGNFPCKGYHNETFQEAAAWKAGEMASFTINVPEKIAAHSGGSCQASISHDGGRTFQVLHSFIGDCPRGAVGNVAGPDQRFDFKIPEDEPAGQAIFSWTWFNTVGVREMYMNCAFVTIQNDNPVPQVKARPFMFVGALATAPDTNGCSSEERTNLQFPDPGDFVTDGSQNAGVQFKGKTLPTGPGCGNEASGGGMPIDMSKALSPNKDLAGGGAVAGPKPGPVNPIPELDPSPTPTQALTTMATYTSTPPADGQKVIYVTEVVTHPVVDIVTVTATTYLASPTDNVAKRHEHIAREKSCSFQETFKIGNECSVPSIKSSQWDACVWEEFCPCLNENLGPADISNFSQIKGYCDCVTNGIGCRNKAVRSRHMQRHVRTTGVDIILRRDEDQMVHTFRA